MTINAKICFYAYEPCHNGGLSFSDRDGQMYRAFVSSGHRSELLGEWSIIVGLGLPSSEGGTKFWFIYVADQIMMSAFCLVKDYSFLGSAIGFLK